MFYGNFSYPQTTYYFCVKQKKSVFKEEMWAPVCCTLEANPPASLV